MAYEALNNLGHSNQRVVIVLNDNGRSYAPTISKLSESLTSLRLNRTYLTVSRARASPRAAPAARRQGRLLRHRRLDRVVREMVTPHTFFENLGVRYVGPIDGHDIEALENALRSAAEWDGPIVVHTLTQKGRGYEPAITDDLKMHDYKLPAAHAERGACDLLHRGLLDALVDAASEDDRIVAITAAMAGPTGLLTSNVASPIASSTSASPNSTPSRRPRAWRWADSSRSSRSTPRSSRAPSTRPTSTWAC